MFSTWKRRPASKSLGVDLPVGPVWRSVALGKSHQLQHVEGIFPASNILLNILNPTSFSDGQIKRVTRMRKEKEKDKLDMNEGLNVSGGFSELLSVSVIYGG